MEGKALYLINAALNSKTDLFYPQQIYGARDDWMGQNYKVLPRGQLCPYLLKLKSPHQNLGALIQEMGQQLEICRPMLISIPVIVSHVTYQVRLTYRKLLFLEQD